MRCKSSGKTKVKPLEPSCRKPIYNSLEDAQVVIDQIKESRITKDLRAYKCGICGLWHLTSKSE